MILDKSAQLLPKFSPLSLSQQAAPCLPLVPTLLLEDRCPTQLLATALFQTLQSLPLPLGSSSNPTAWHPELFLLWFLPSSEVLLPITFTPHQIQPPSQTGGALSCSGPLAAMLSYQPEWQLPMLQVSLKMSFPETLSCSLLWIPKVQYTYFGESTHQVVSLGA